MEYSIWTRGQTIWKALTKYLIVLHNLESCNLDPDVNNMAVTPSNDVEPIIYIDVLVTVRSNYTLKWNIDALKR
jgi:hypothetical protein